MFKNLELEWKILILAGVLLVAFAWPMQRLFVNRLTQTLEQSHNPKHERILRRLLPDANDQERQDIIADLKRNRQWKALIPIIIREQRFAVISFSILLSLVLILLSIWTLRRLTQPLKELARSVMLIGKGSFAEIKVSSGGALGRLEKAVSQMQDELAVLRKEAQLKGMESAWQDIARVMAHEIKNPLTPIRLTLDRMEERTLEGMDISADNLKTFLARINNQVDALERLVNQFRSFSKDPDAKPKRLAARPLIEETAATLAAKMETAIDGDVDICVDSYLMNQVLLNLWKNALEAGATRMAVTLAKNQDNETWIRIKDNGSGIPADELDHVWLPYVSMKRGGTGLGLPVVKRLVETMHGRVVLASRTSGDDHGLTILITFPNEIPPEEVAHA
ncbi:MAG: HAMP domain-containing protein [Chitinivibrionales bacterium]|nr:HAMP domain-containing protein [Chitinivibrionales bacterium]